MNPPETEHWLFLIRTEDRPGAAAAIAMVFSGRGIQIESFIGYGDPACSPDGREGMIAITFHAFRPRMEVVRRVLTRLEAVRSVDCHDYARDPRLLKTATVRLTASAWTEGVEAALSRIPVSLSRVGVEAGDPVLVLAGRPVAVDQALTVLAERGWLEAAAYAFLPATDAVGSDPGVDKGKGDGR
ncbi:MAG: hypothetical protein WDA75_00225 [Candidatus Latescibacterota bacterium]